MPSRPRLLLAGGVVLLVGLVAFFPARVAYQWFAPPDVKLSGIDGSLWNGAVSEASISGVYLRNLQWHFKPLQLLQGKLGYAIEASPVSGFVEGNLAVGITGNVSASELNASLPLRALQQVIRRPGLAGSLNVQFSQLLLEDGIPVAADGTVEVANLVLPKVHRFSIGGYRAEFLSQESGVMASLEDVDGMVDLAGTLQLSGDRSYKVIALVAPKDETPENIRRQMQFLGSANERGQHELRLEGQL